MKARKEHPKILIELIVELLLHKQNVSAIQSLYKG